MLYNEVEKVLSNRETFHEPIKIGIAGTGFVGRGLINQLQLIKGMRIVAVANRNTNKAVQVLKNAGLEKDKISVCLNKAEIISACAKGMTAVVSDMLHLVEAGVDLIVDCSGDPQAGVVLALSSLDSGIDFIAAPEMDSLVGLALYKIAQEKGVIYSGADGDEPGVTMGLYRYVKLLGFRIVAAGKFKGFYNPQANPGTVHLWANQYRQNPYMISSFADGTKMNIEMAILANASGLVPDKRGMNCPEAALSSVCRVLSLKEKGGVLESEGVVEIVRNVEPSGGVFVVATVENNQIRKDLQYLKMGEGPNYLFYRPYHLGGIEIVVTIIRVAVHREASIVPQKRVAGVLSIAKKALETGDILDKIGGYTFYGQIDREEIIQSSRLLPVLLADDAKVIKRKAINEPIYLDDVELKDESALYKLWLNDR